MSREATLCVTTKGHRFYDRHRRSSPSSSPLGRARLLRLYIDRHLQLLRAKQQGQLPQLPDHNNSKRNGHLYACKLSSVGRRLEVIEARGRGRQGSRLWPLQYGSADFRGLFHFHFHRSDLMKA